ncbi:MAG: hypothetical protein HY721_00575 [Planctomycetes bacterium]|nr:hypothetical protein [Planctomycetota bacterium]
MARPAALLLLTFGVPAGLLLAGASWRWLGLGALAWAAAVAVKALAGALVAGASRRAVSSARARAAVWGVWSAACELGAAALAFLAFRPRPTLLDVAGCGAGAGALEIAWVVAVAVYHGAAATAAREGPPDEPDDTDWIVRWSGVLERASTLAGHIGSRGLVWLGLQSWALSPALALALATFALVDGVAGYGVDAGWRWSEPRLCRRFQAFLAATALVELGAFAGGAFIASADP